MAAYANWLHEAAGEFGVSIHAWVFMTNHVHLLATPNRGDSLSRMMQCLGRQYVRYFNWKHERTGTLFDGRFKASVVQEDEHLMNCHRYIELNPVRAGIVDLPGDYPWSSYRSHALGLPVKMWTPHSFYCDLGEKWDDRQKEYRRLFSAVLGDREVEEIRFSVNRGFALGSENFRRKIETLTGMPQGPRPMGRPRKQSESGE